MTTTPKPRHGCLSAPLFLGWWWSWQPHNGFVYEHPILVSEAWIKDRASLPPAPGTLWHPCIPPLPPLSCPSSAWITFSTAIGNVLGAGLAWSSRIPGIVAGVAWGREWRVMRESTLTDVP